MLQTDEQRQELEVNGWRQVGTRRGGTVTKECVDTLKEEALMEPMPS